MYNLHMVPSKCNSRTNQIHWKGSEILVFNLILTYLFDFYNSNNKNSVNLTLKKPYVYIIFRGMKILTKNKGFNGRKEHTNEIRHAC